MPGFFTSDEWMRVSTIELKKIKLKAGYIEFAWLPAVTDSEPQLP